MITLGKRGKKYMNQVKGSGNMRTGGGTISITQVTKNYKKDFMNNLNQKLN